MVTLINPNLAAQKNDFFTTGIVYMPIGLAYFAAALKKKGIPYKVIDAFGEKPSQARIKGNFLIQGLTLSEVIGAVPEETEIIFIYASNITYFLALTDIIQALKSRFPKIPLAVLENTQAVTAFSLKETENELYDSGADFILTGEPERRGLSLIEKLAAKKDDFQEIDGLGYRKSGAICYTQPLAKIQNLDTLAFPEWESFPLANYWRLRYSHGPQETARYLPLLTSRGCSYSCNFCLMPAVNHGQWRFRSAKNVVDEMQYYLERFAVSEFHIEDVNPTISDERMRGICEEIITRGLKVIWKLVSGTKIETIKSSRTLELMARAGCNYISISPESGSPGVLKLMNKPFDLEHAINMVKAMRTFKIFSQACFILGFPGEGREDLKKTKRLVAKLSRSGIDEIAVFINTPVPGAKIFKELKGYGSFSQLNFSPTWRSDYARLNSERLKLYAIFLANKAGAHFFRLAVQPLRFLRRSFKTKMEMVPYRALKMNFILWRSKNES